MAKAEDLSLEQRRRGMIAAIAGVSVFAACLGHSLPFFAVRLATLGADNTLVGFNVALSAVSGLALTPFLPGLISRFGIRSALAAAIVTVLAGYALAYIAGERFILWHAARLLIGAGATAIFVASELWINLVAPPERRGSVIGLYGAFLAAGFAAGPLALEATGYEGATPFFAGAGFVLLSVPALFLAAAPAFEPDERDASMAWVARQAPTIFLAMAIFALAEAALLSLSPVYGLRIGLPPDAAGRIVLCYALGSLALQYPIGRLIDRFSTLGVLAACAAIGLAGAATLPFAAASAALLYPMVFVWGGAVVGIGTCVLTYAGVRFRGKELAAANAAIAFSYNAGALTGPALAGWLMDLGGADALSLTLAAAFLSLLVMAAARRRGLSA